MATRKRDYKHEYAAYQGTPEQIHKRSLRNQARRKLEKKLGHDIPHNVDVGHKKALDNKGSNSTSNLKLQSRKDNRSWRKGVKGYKVKNV